MAPSASTPWQAGLVWPPVGEKKGARAAMEEREGFRCAPSPSLARHPLASASAMRAMDERDGRRCSAVRARGGRRRPRGRRPLPLLRRRGRALARPSGKQGERETGATGRRRHIAGGGGEEEAGEGSSCCCRRERMLLLRCVHACGCVREKRIRWRRGTLVGEQREKNDGVRAGRWRRSMQEERGGGRGHGEEEIGGH